MCAEHVPEEEEEDVFYAFRFSFFLGEDPWIPDTELVVSFTDPAIENLTAGEWAAEACLKWEDEDGQECYEEAECRQETDTCTLSLESGALTDSVCVLYAAAPRIFTGTAETDGGACRITAACESPGQVPPGAELSIKEVAGEEGLQYLTDAARALGRDLHSLAYGRTFDIALVKGEEALPAGDGMTVTADLSEAGKTENLRVVSFDRKEGEAREVISSADGSESHLRRKEHPSSLFSISVWRRGALTPGSKKREASFMKTTTSFWKAACRPTAL